MDCSTPSFTISQSLLKLMSIESVMLSNHLLLCHPLLLPSVFPGIRVFSNESALRIRWPKFWRFSFSISPSNEYSELISFRIDWLDLLAVQGTLKSLLQHLSLKASVLRCSAFFMVQPSHPYMTNGRNHSFDYIDLCWQNDGSAFVIAFLPRKKHLLVSWLQSPSISDFGVQENKSLIVSIVSPSICCEVMGPDAMILFF